MREIFLDIYLAKNLGDDLFLHLFADHFKDDCITVFYPGNDYDDLISKYKNVRTFPYNTVDKILRVSKIYNKLTDYKRIADTYDVLVFLGGGIFREEVYADDLYQYRSAIVNEFKIRNKLTYFLGCNFGPFNTEFFKNKHARLFESSTQVCFRDVESYYIFKGSHNISYAPDIVWGMDLSFYNKKHRSKPTIGISVINPHHKHDLKHLYDEYIVAHVAYIKKAISINYHVNLFSFCAQEGDVEIINQIKIKLTTEEQRHLSWFNYNGDITTFIEEFISSDYIVAARFHAVILALVARIPVFPVIYSVKTLNLLKDIKFNNPVIDFKSLDLLASAMPTDNYEFVSIDDFILRSSGHFALLN